MEKHIKNEVIDMVRIAQFKCYALPAPNVTAEYDVSPPAGTYSSWNSMSLIECVQIRRELGAEDLP